jgi:hypothetical protein
LTQNGTASAVVQDYATYRALQDAFLLLKLMVQGEADVQRNRLVPQEKVFGSLRASLLIQQNPSGLKQQKPSGLKQQKQHG